MTICLTNLYVDCVNLFKGRFQKRISPYLVMHAYWQSTKGIWITLCINQGVAATTTMGMHLWIWMQQMHNADNLTTILYISRTNVQHAIIAVKIVILHMIVTLKRKIISLQDLHSPSINHNHHCITTIRP